MIVQTIVALIAAVLLSVRMMRQRAFHLNRLWIQPAAVIVVVAFVLLGSHPTPIFYAAIAAGIIVGIGIGVLRAAMSIDRVDLATNCIMTKPNLWMAALFAATFALQLVVRHGPWSALRDATDGLMCLTAASICAQRWQFYRAFRNAADVGKLHPAS